ncbi:SH3 domain-containing protein [Streptomyces boninensis]|uniref:SH3 domain-containing protein n=1 Tax=Streptomyces boninensis TaxID=2039455 RepID=UPI003B21A583
MLKRTKTTAAVAAGAIAFGALAVSPAMAASSVAPQGMKTWNDEARGVVTGYNGIAVRARPTMNSEKIGRYGRSHIANIVCKCAGQDVAGNGIWFKVRKHDDPSRHGWISARYVKNVDYVPWCDDHRGGGDGTWGY